MFRILSEEPLFESLDALEIALPIELGALLHGLEGGPGLGVDDVGVLEGFLHVVGDGELGAGLFAVLLRHLHHVVHDLIALGIGQGHVHAEPGEQARHALGHGQGLAVGGAVGPGHGHLLALQVLDRFVEIVAAAQGVDAVEHVRHALGGMVDVALEVDQGGLLLQDARFMSLSHSVHDIVHVFVSLADVHVVADPDDIRHEGDHVGCLADGLAMCDLALALVQILNLQTEQVAGGGKGEAGAGGIVSEKGNAQTGLKHFGGNIVLPHIPESIRHGKDRLDLIVGLLPGEKEVSLVHLFKIQTVQFVNIAL